MVAFGWGRLWTSRSRTQGEAFGGAKGEPEDNEMLEPQASSRRARVVGLLIWGADYRDVPRANRRTPLAPFSRME